METVKISVSSLIDIIQGIGTIPKLTVDIPATKYTPSFSTDISFDWFSQYKNYTDLIITGFVYIAFLWRLFISLPSTISGVGGVNNPPDIKMDNINIDFKDSDWY